MPDIGVYYGGGFGILQEKIIQEPAKGAFARIPGPNNKDFLPSPLNNPVSGGTPFRRNIDMAHALITGRFLPVPSGEVFYVPGNQGGPACLMARPESSPRVTVKILVEKYEIAPVWVF